MYQFSKILFSFDQKGKKKKVYSEFLDTLYLQMLMKVEEAMIVQIQYFVNMISHRNISVPFQQHETDTKLFTTR